MTKKMISFLTALSVLSAMPLSVSAEFSYEEYFASVLDYMECMDTTISDGETLYLKQWDGSAFAGLVAVTDGTELTAEAVGLTDCTEVLPWEGFTADWRELDGFSIKSEQLPEGCTAYFLRMTSQNAKELRAAARAYALSEQPIMKLYTVSLEEYDGFSWDGRFTVYTSSDVETLDPADFPELAELNGSFRLSETDTENGINYWEFRPDSAAVNELYARYAESTMQQLHAYAKNIEAELNANHKDIVLLANADFGFTMESNPDNPTLYTLGDVWTNGGDFDSDGEVNSTDAAEMLTYSALSGALVTGTLTTAQQDAGDLNGDGIVDAADAANVLVYSAQKGTGHDPEWFDILKSR